MNLAKRVHTKSTSSGPRVSRATGNQSEKFLGRAQADRFKILGSRTILAEKVVVPRGDEDAPYANMWGFLENRNWERVFEPHTVIDYDIVKEFYANALKTTDESVAYSYQSYVRGKTVAFDRESISEFLGEPLQLGENEKCFYRQNVNNCASMVELMTETICDRGRGPELSRQGNPTHYNRKNLNIQARGILSVILYNIRPRTHVTTIPLDVAFLITAIMTENTVDVAFILSNELRRAALSDTQHDINAKCVLPLPGLIMGLCKEAGVEIPGQGHHVINTFIDDVYIDRFCAKPYYKDQAADSPPAGPSVSAAPPQGSAAPFEPLVAHHYYSAMFEANQRSQIFLHDAMQQQFRNLSVAPEERTFPTRESYFTYCGWPETNPFPIGGDAGGDTGADAGGTAGADNQEQENDADIEADIDAMFV